MTDPSRGTKPPLECQRDRFSLPPGTHFLNCAYMAPLSQAVEDAGITGLRRKRDPAKIPAADLFRGPDAIRAAFAQLIHAHPRQIALVPSVSYAMAIATRNLRVQRNQTVVVIGREFPSAVLPWRRLAREQGLRLRTVEAPHSATPGAAWNACLHAAIDASTAVVVLAPVHWEDGTRFELEALAERARAMGAAVVVDGTQAVGALPFDVRRIQPDLLVCAGYKWLMGGYGLSVAYIGPRFEEGVPLEETWTGQCASDEFTRLAEYRDTYRSTAERYDGGERAHFSLVPMLCTAIEQLLAWDVAEIQRYCAQLWAPWLDRLAAYGVALPHPEEHAAHLVGLRVAQSCDLSMLAGQLAARQVSVSVRGDVIRVAPHVYNDAADMAVLFETLRAALRGVPDAMLGDTDAG